MPVHKFDDSEAARRALWVEPGDPVLAGRIRTLWAFSRRLAPVPHRMGLRKFETIAAANADREDWIRERIGELRSRRWRLTAGE